MAAISLVDCPTKIGSWFFLSEILLDIELDFDQEFSEDLCGSCTACIDLCPTEALEDYVLDANKCISYLTIEHRDEISKDFSDKMNDWIYGCDICQEVCPWNEKFSQVTIQNYFYPKKEILYWTNEDWERIDEEGFRKLFKGSAVKRTKYSGLSRNINANR